MALATDRCGNLDLCSGLLIGRGGGISGDGSGLSSYAVTSRHELPGVEGTYSEVTIAMESGSLGISRRCG
ncbi:hypothetical protein SMICM304S_06590 [Streptomyces microflavus]